ncbi:acyl-CoA thioesterase [Mangrovicoccus ximenensis]|uniref:acyl-CoA thioesterase n=1 Tax=Mangrovicoccus ximenensis TaxID=1911570 RepID=UPI0011AEB4F9|nr:thioesterase family protein [Mangrovicoccus ximenensis]
MLRPTDFDAAGNLTMEAVQGKVAEGNAPFWMASGLPPDAFYGRGLGRVNVELKIERLGPARPGMPVRLVTWFGPPGSKTVEVCHQLEDLATGAALAAVRAVSLIIDLDSRRPIGLPGEIRRLLG